MTFKKSIKKVKIEVAEIELIKLNIKREVKLARKDYGQEIKLDESLGKAKRQRPKRQSTREKEEKRLTY